MPSYGTFKWDMVKGARVARTAATGQIDRMARFYGNLPGGNVSDTGALLKALEDSGCPQEGDSFPRTGYEDWLLRSLEVYPIDARHFDMRFIYVWDGLLYIKDTSTLTSVPTQLHPDTLLPMYVKWSAPDDPTDVDPVTKLLTLQGTLPLRHIMASQTIPHMASADILNAFGGVNNNTWKGKPKGYWLFSQLEGETLNGGITYHYSVTLSTKQKEDWSQVGFMTDDRGQAVAVPPSDVAALRGTPYAYTINDTINGILKTGLFPEIDFSAIFGF